jgi:filamin
VNIRNIPKFIEADQLHKDLSFEIDARAAGSGNLEIVINQGTVTCRVREMATRQFLAQFTPTQPVPHLIELKFNNEHIRGSPWNVPLRSSADYQNGDSHHTTHQNLTSSVPASDEER